MVLNFSVFFFLILKKNKKVRLQTIQIERLGDTATRAVRPETCSG